MNNGYMCFKRGMDAFFCLVLLPIIFPIMGLLVLFIKLDSKGPVLFRQQRVGKGCKIFTIYKFRTMRTETEQDGKPLSDMERMTKVGNVLRKLSLDELPQLFNILKGDMSFIGPRPLLVEYIPRYSETQIRRHEVLPGITGYAQINGRNALEWEKKFEMDVWYVDHICLHIDFKIFFQTIAVIFKHKGINQEINQTMSYFMGSSVQGDTK